jgi:EamA domain-containing membrane protein RarD
MNNPLNRPANNPSDIALRNALQGLAADIAHHHAPPPASIVWLRAQRRARQHAIARATLPLRIMSLIGLVAAIAFATFALRQSSAAALTSARVLLAWIAPALALILAGCWFILRKDNASHTAPDN